MGEPGRWEKWGEESKERKSVGFCVVKVLLELFGPLRRCRSLLTVRLINSSPIAYFITYHLTHNTKNILFPIPTPYFS